MINKEIYSFAKKTVYKNGKLLILVVDDDKTIRFVLKRLLIKNGYNVETTGNYSGLRRLISEINPDLLITDVKLPDGNVLNFLPQIKKSFPLLPIIIISAQSTLNTAVKSIKKGAFDYISKPFDLDDLLEATKKALSFENEEDNNKKDSLIFNIQSDNFSNSLIGKSQSMQEVFYSISKLLKSNLSVLITGETGTGKELIAKTIHKLNFESEDNFISLNMGSIRSEELEETLLKNYNKSFGRSLNVSNKTLYLNSIDEMTVFSQNKLLDILRTFYSVNNPIESNFSRIIASSKKQLTDLIKDGCFCEDLFYYLNVIPINVPALRERKDDIPHLVNYFLKQTSIKNLPQKKFNDNSFKELMLYDWPGNIRELENLINRISIFYPENVISSLSIKKEIKKSSYKTMKSFNSFSGTL